MCVVIEGILDQISRIELFHHCDKFGTVIGLHIILENKMDQLEKLEDNMNRGKGRRKGAKELNDFEGWIRDNVHHDFLGHKGIGYVQFQNIYEAQAAILYSIYTFSGDIDKRGRTLIFSLSDKEFVIQANHVDKVSMERGLGLSGPRVSAYGDRAVFQDKSNHWGLPPRSWQRNKSQNFECRDESWGYGNSRSTSSRGYQ